MLSLKRTVWDIPGGVEITMSGYIMNTKFYKQPDTQEEKRWCMTHPTSVWGKDQFGNWYTRCTYGNRLNEDCKLGEDDKVSER